MFKAIKPGKLRLAAALVISLLAAGALAALAQEAPLISQEALKEALGAPGLVIIDVRTAGDWTASDRKIKGAVREDPQNPGEWARKYDPTRRLVLYCA